MGGSGGGGRGLTYREEEALENMARSSMRQAAEPEKHNVFISFAMENENEVNLLRGQAKKEDSNLEFNDYSVKEAYDSKNADYIKRGIREKIKQCSVTLVYVSNDTGTSKWVDWEIRESIRLGKGVVAMYKEGTKPTNLPPAIGEFKIKLVPWNHKAITNAVHEAAKKRE
jgi:MTH538 TIR-like domain (DUF1863)